MIGRVIRNICLISGLLAITAPVRGQAPAVLTLEQSIKVALGQSYDVKRLEQSLISSRMNLRSAEAGFKSNGELQLSSLPNFQQNERRTALPGGTFIFERQQFMDLQTDVLANQPVGRTDGVISLVGSLQRFQQFDVLNQATNTTSDPSQYGTQVRVQFRQPLFTYNRLKLGLRRAELNLQTTLQTYSRNQLDIVFNVSSRFYDLFRSQQQLMLDELQVSQAEEAFRIARLKADAGLLAEVEVLRLDIDLANARNTAANSEATLRQNEDTFKLQIGIAIETPIEVTTDLAYREVSVPLERAVDEALTRRTELRTDDITIQLSQLSITETDAQREVSGELFVSYGLFSRRDRLLDAFNQFNNDRRVQFSVNVPLWDWSQNRYAVQAAQATLENDRLARENRVNTIKQEIRATVRSFESAQQRVEITRRSEELAEQSYRISFLRFENGEVSTQDLALEQNRLAQARRNSLDAIIDYKQSLADLRRKTLWDFEKDEPVPVDVEQR
ncbi:MAG: TolC family protein [Candidatus Latescibacteria bacterium]|nr:TolC family protein [Candidatus Latescibacterota bacterium]